MSEVQKPVEEPVAAPTTETPVVEPVAESQAVEETPAPTETATETPAVAEPAPATTEEGAPAKEEAKPVEEGVLGYKAPGLIKGFIFQKKHFWFGSEAVESKHLSSYLRGEKPEHANHNAAWASHTGKGLLFFAKKASEKTNPAGVINLSDASEPTNDGTSEFFVNIHGQKHTFQAANFAERENWVATLKTKITEAKDLSESVTGSETYKKTHSSLAKPIVAAVAAPKKSTEVKKEEKAEKKEEKAEAKEEKKEAQEEKKEEKKEIKEEKKEEKVEAKEEKKARKSRSASRKRNSIFGSIGFGKKEEKTEPKEETSAAAVATEETAVPAETAPVEPVSPVVAEATPVAAAPVEEAKPVETKPVPTKRNSIFGSLKSQFAPKEKKAEEVAPAVPAKDADPVSETAPVIPAVEATEPLATSVASLATVPVETTAAPVTNGDNKAADTAAVKVEKRKSSLPWLSKKEKATTSDEEGEKPKSPFAKLRATVKGKTPTKAAEKPVEKPVEETAKPAEEAPATAEPVAPAATEPVVGEPVPAAHTSTPQVSATA